MFELIPGLSKKPSVSILCLGAHSDDIEIGCGGTILRLLRHYKNCHVTWVVFSADGKREPEARRSSKRFLAEAKKTTIIIKHFRESFFPYKGADIKKCFEWLKVRVSPDVIFTHYRHDLHQDHRVISELTWNTFRRHPILEYEIPKYDGDLGCPNVYMALSEDICKTKIRYLLECFTTQQGKHWFMEDTFMALLRIRGMEAGTVGKYAEAFYGRKIVML